MLALNPAQRDAVEASDSVFVSACPGSGKTRVLVARVTRILTEDPNTKVLMTTFSREAVNEMIARVKMERSIPRAALQNLTVGTFHALALHQLKEVKGNVHLLSTIELRHLINKAIGKARLPITWEDADAIIARCKADPEYAERNPAFSRLTQYYIEAQREIGSWDFTDLLLEANYGMKTGKIPPIKAHHILADEFQDIDKPQFDWLLHHARQKPVMCAVGDDDQSIYGFRRALGFSGIEQFVKAVGARKIILNINYRSTDAIVKPASKLIQHNKQRLKKEVRVYRGTGISPTVLTESEQDSQVMKIVRRLDKICANNPIPDPWPTPESEPYRFGVKKGQVAVLSRTNAQLMLIEAVFRSLRIPYYKTGKSVWDNNTIQAYLSLLEALDSGTETGLRIALQWAKVRDKEIDAVLALAGKKKIMSLLESGVPQRVAHAINNPNLVAFVHFGNAWLNKLGEGDCLAAIYGVAGWMCSTLADEDEAFTSDPRVKGEVYRLEIARDALAAARGSLKARIQRVKKADGNKEMPRVILATFHAAKGMEWEHVFLIDVNESIVPKLSPDGGWEELEEERRVFYVAMTRARDTLTILGNRKKAMSPFLVEAGLLTHEDAVKGVARAYGKVFKPTKKKLRNGKGDFVC